MIQLAVGDVLIATYTNKKIKLTKSCLFYYSKYVTTFGPQTGTNENRKTINFKDDSPKSQQTEKKIKIVSSSIPGSSSEVNLF